MIDDLYKFTIDNWIAILAVLISILSLAISYKNYRVSKKTLEAAIQPYLSLELIPDVKNAIPNLIYLYLKNDGSSTAYDIKFTVIGTNHLDEKIKEIGFIKHGIPNISSKHEISTILFNSIQTNKSAPNFLEFESSVKISYKDINKKKHSYTLTLSTKHLDGLQCTENSMSRIANSLDTISRKYR